MILDSCPQPWPKMAIPIDVLLLMDAPAFPGCVIESRLIGVIEGEQSTNGKTERNDRLIAVANRSHTHSDMPKISDMNARFVKDVAEFFVNYNRQDDVIISFWEPKEAVRLLDQALKARQSCLVRVQPKLSESVLSGALATIVF
jgi:inorganic pyrophosphatase